MSGSQDPIAAIAEAALRRAIDEAANRIGAALPDVVVAASEDGVTLSGRGLLKRLVSDGRLRWISGLLK